MPVPKEEVDRQLSEFNQEFDDLLVKKEIKHLPKIMMIGEEIKAITRGIHEGNTWIIVATQKRIIFLDKGMVTGLNQKELMLDKIKSVSHKIGLMRGKVKIDTGGGEKTISGIPKKYVSPFVKRVSKLLQKQRKENTSSNKEEKKTSKNQSGISRLEKLAELKDKGVITEEEFKKKKKEILNKL